jgi:hypothetical protein
MVPRQVHARRRLQCVRRQWSAAVFPPIKTLRCIPGPFRNMGGSDLEICHDAKKVLANPNPLLPVRRLKVRALPARARIRNFDAAVIDVGSLRRPSAINIIFVPTHFLYCPSRPIRPFDAFPQRKTSPSLTALPCVPNGKLPCGNIASLTSVMLGTALRSALLTS